MMPLTVCSRCVLDSSDPDIRFDAQGVCQYCHAAAVDLRSVRFTREESEQRLQRLAAAIRTDAKGNEYDSILGMSGGVDSSYVAYIAWKLGLKPLVVHFDNGWNAEVAVSNIKKIIEKCGFDLYTYVIDWPEFRDVQRSFFKASVIDIEMVTDHAIFAAMFRLARKHGIRTVLSGTNKATEHGMPPTWLWRKQDLTNLRAIQRRFGTMKLKTFPTMGSLEWLVYTKLGLGLKYVEPLNNLNYRKSDAITTLNNEFGWQYYGGKHYESTFTKFYQAHILPTKFGIDKRKVHLSCLIRNDEMTREEALAELALPLYDPAELQRDTAYVCKKLGFSEEEFDALMQEKPKPHTAYPSDEFYIRPMRRLALSLLRRNAGAVG